MSVGFRVRYRRVFSDLVRKPSARDGFAPEMLGAAERRLGIKLPKALRDYYALVGRHRLNRAHNRLYPPTGLFLGKEHLVIMEENQAVVCWGIRCDELRDRDPEVYKAVDVNNGPWCSEEVCCSEFLTAMLCWQTFAGTFPYVGYAERVGAEIVQQVERSWSLIARTPDMEAFGEIGQVVCVLPEGKTSSVQIGTRTRRDFRNAEKTLGVRFHEA